MHKFPVDFFYLIKFKKIKSNHLNLRVSEENDNSVIGYAPYLPKEKVSFLMFAKGLEGGVRIIKTSAIKALSSPTEKSPRLYSIETENSEYEVLVLDRVESSLVEEFIENSLAMNDPAIERYMDKLDEYIPKNLN